MNERMRKAEGLKADAWYLAKAFATKYGSGKDRDLGDVSAGIIDIYDSVIDIYGEILPRIARLDGGATEGLLEEIVDLELELQHIRDHTRDALRGLRHLSEDLRHTLDPVEPIS